ncbi:MAG TPA: glucose-6-phosphate dehydrogenase assembly protein OpcA [Chloroflexota bacterium]
MTQPAAVWEGKGVSLGQLDSQLQRLYQQADSQFDSNGHRADIRTSVLNLVVYAPNEECCVRTTAAMEHLSGTHPSRAIVIVPGTSHGDPAIDCRLSIHSHGAYAEYRQICSEQMVLYVHGPVSQHLASVVQPLLAPDLPVFVWWPGEAPFHHHVYGQLRELADRFIVDSSDFANPVQDLVAMSHAVHAAGVKTAFSDFNWTRLAPWRERIAQFFDRAQNRAYLDRLKVIWIECAPTRSGSAHIQPLVLLLGGWLASSLGLHAEKRQLSQDHYELALGDGVRQLHLNIRVAPPRDDPMVRIRLEAPAGGDMPAAEFSVAADGAEGQVTVATRFAGTEASSRRIKLAPRSEADVLFDQLEIFRHEPAYEAALSSAASMLDPSYHRELVKGSLLV